MIFFLAIFTIRMTINLSLCLSEHKCHFIYYSWWEWRNITPCITHLCLQLYVCICVFVVVLSCMSHCSLHTNRYFPFFFILYHISLFMTRSMCISISRQQSIVCQKHGLRGMHKWHQIHPSIFRSVNQKRTPFACANQYAFLIVWAQWWLRAKVNEALVQLVLLCYRQYVICTGYSNWSISMDEMFPYLFFKRSPQQETNTGTSSAEWK